MWLQNKEKAIRKQKKIYTKVVQSNLETINKYFIVCMYEIIYLNH